MTGPSIPDLELARVRTIISAHLSEISGLFVSGTKFTLLARQPSHPDGSRDLVVTNDELGPSVAALRQRASTIVRPRSAREPVKIIVEIFGGSADGKTLEDDLQLGDTVVIRDRNGRAALRLERRDDGSIYVAMANRGASIPINDLLK